MKKLLTLFFLGWSLCGHAQVDPHFSQYYAYPLWLNPALTGGFDGGLRITGIYRNQWGSITNPFATMGLSADVVTGANINFGANIFRQTAGDAGYHYTTATASIAYSGVRFGSDGAQQLVIGIQGGLISRGFNPAKFQFGDQWNASTGFNPASPSADLLTKTSAAALDLGAGIAYLDYSQDKNINFFGGFSAMHLNGPEDPFINGNKQKLPMRFTVHAGAKIIVAEKISITPNLLYLRQGTSEEKMIGAAAEIALQDNTSFIFGSNYRFEDAIAPFVGVRYNDFVLGASYDKTISNLGKMVSNTSSIELSLRYILPKTEGKEIPCPKF
jgi:type IX secretion system PorP/SprF family membrane protein